jgi:hypothetical protein
MKKEQHTDTPSKELTIYKPPSHFRRIATALGLSGLIAACAGPQVQDYANERPTLDLREYFDGKVIAHGIFSDRFGKVIRRFIVEMDGKWDGDNGVLDETFYYLESNAKEKESKRIWKLRYMGKVDNKDYYTGTAEDVKGTAEGYVSGNAFRWNYTLMLPIDGRVWEVQFDDWMYLIDENILINKAVMSKWGIRLGEVTLSFVKKKDTADAAQ